jgi:hypothetical protein
MKRKFALLTLILLAFAAQTFAQTKFQSLKFDEFDDSPELYYSMTETSLSERINRFIAQIDKERGKKIYIRPLAKLNFESFEFKVVDA